MKKIPHLLLILFLPSMVLSQETRTEELSEVVVTAVNYKYLSSTDAEEIPIPVKLLKRKVAAYDVTQSELYEDDYPFYTVSFYIPEGKIVAVYDEEGNIIKTIERFKDLQLPKEVETALKKRYKGWEAVEDVYLIEYNNKKGVNRTFKVTLIKGKKTQKVKLDETGRFL
tara:strand:+ start:13749 stop:14255 length:507 start_codon:yes stop_codon:yes gene_type:complete